MLFHEWIHQIKSINDVPHSLILNLGPNINIQTILINYFSHVVNLKPELDNDIKKQMINAFIINQYEDLITVKDNEKMWYTKSDLLPIFEAIKFTIMEPHQIRLIVIYDAEKLNKATSNSILKLIEEPNINTYIVLLCNNYESLLDTIKSRCVYFNVINKIQNKLDSKKPKNALIYANYNEQEIESFLATIETKDLFDFAKTFLENQNTSLCETFNYESEKKFLNLSLTEATVFCDYLIFLLKNNNDYFSVKLTHNLLLFKNNLNHHNTRLSYLYLLTLLQQN